jgi:hypothetical protein
MRALALAETARAIAGFAEALAVGFEQTAASLDTITRAATPLTRPTPKD